jgi:hypothetical protein
VDDNVPKKSGGDDKKEKQGKFTDGNAAPKKPVGVPPPPPPKKGGKALPAPKGGAKDKPKGKPDELKSFGDAMTKIKALEGHKPMTRAEITSTIETIKNQYNVPGIIVIPKGTDRWKITGSLAGKKNKQSVYVPANMTPGDEKVKKGDEALKDKELAKGLAALKKKDEDVAGDGILERKEALRVANEVQQKHANVFKSISVIDKGDHWNYRYIQKADELEGSNQPTKHVEPLPALDATGKVHGTLPKVQDLYKYSKEDLEILLQELKISVKKRIEVTAIMGRDRGHGQRQGAEQDLIHAITRFLENTNNNRIK